MALAYSLADCDCSTHFVVDREIGLPEIVTFGVGLEICSIELVNARSICALFVRLLFMVLGAIR